MHKKLLLGSAFGLLFGAAVLAQAADMKVVKPMRGTIESVQGETLNFTARSGQKQSIALTEKTALRAVSKAKLDDIAANSFVGSAATPQPDGTLKALEVTVFEASLKGSGEGHYGWENADGSTGTMTNGTVGKLVKSNGRTLTVTYGNQQKTVIVPEDVPIVTLDPGDLSLLKPGVHIVLFSAVNDKGERIATRISAGKDGTVPPM